MRLSTQRGFGLVEIMVGMLIGMLASIVIFQVFSLAERQKRTTTGSADAQTNSAFALYAIERDAKMAGFGLESDSLAACTRTYSYVDNGTSQASIPEFNIPAAISITDGGGSSADQIQIVYYSPPGDDNFIIPSRTTLRGAMANASSELDVNSTAGCVANKLALVQQAGNCTVMQVTEVKGAALRIVHAGGGAGTAEHPVYNPDAAYLTANSWPIYTSGAVVRCGLDTPVSRTYRLNANTLESLDSTAANAQTLVPNIVALQAQYGVADVGGLAINRNDQWVDATAGWGHGVLNLASGYGKRI